MGVISVQTVEASIAVQAGRSKRFLVTHERQSIGHKLAVESIVSQLIAEAEAEEVLGRPVWIE
jgi:hypothetical protein